MREPPVDQTQRDLGRLPKAHLHVHLESTVRWSTLRELADANGIAPPARPDGPPVFDGFRAFGDYNALIRRCLVTPADFVRVAREFCADSAADGVRYAEVSFSATSHGERLGDPDMPLESVLRGLDEGRKGDMASLRSGEPLRAAHGVECRVLLDHSRRRPGERADATLALARRYPVAGIGLAGDEAYPARPFAGILDAAREAGLHLVHHAGETAGPASIREAIEVGHTERIGHGIRVLDDAELLAEVRDRGIPLEVCPSSNLALGLVGSLAAHPLPRLLDAGLAVTLNTDIPNVTGTSLTEEYARVRDTFGLSDEVLAELNRAAIDASFAPESTKERLRQATAEWLS